VQPDAFIPIYFIIYQKTLKIMELGTTLMGVTLLVLCSLPFLLAMKGQKTKEKKLLRSLQSLAAPFNTKISEKDCYANFAIGLDEAHEHVYYYKKSKEMDFKNCIEINELKHCHVNKIGPNGNVKAEHIDRLELVLQPKDAKKPNQVLEFFTSQDFINVNGELLLAEKWENNINKLIHAKVG
tara:strand:- start:1685 stop:2230 length:546 start_codon:yes stop_codon:yes gene_type:complete